MLLSLLNLLYEVFLYVSVNFVEFLGEYQTKSQAHSNFILNYISWFEQFIEDLPTYQKMEQNVKTKP